jgi:acetyl-CoA acetyltransferase
MRSCPVQTGERPKRHFVADEDDPANNHLRWPRRTSRPSFNAPDMRDRFPHLRLANHAGQLIAPDRRSLRGADHGRGHRGEARSYPPAHASALLRWPAGDPLFMLTAPIPASQQVLDRAELDIDAIDAYEVNEAFAPVPLVWLAEMGGDPEKLNPRGGAIALGHPLGASGIRVMGTLLNHLGVATLGRRRNAW